MPKQGDPIPLTAQLALGETDRFVRAILRDQNGIGVLGSPVVLTHVGEGTHKDMSVSMPGTRFVTASYKSFLDAGLSISDDSYMEEMERFDLEQAIPPAGTVILSPVNLTGRLRADQLSATMGSDSLKGSMPAAELTGTIEEDSVSAEAADNELSAAMSQNRLTERTECAED